MSEVSGADRELVREELAWIADWLRRKYPNLDVRSYIREQVPISA